jgi:hypothetical protein
MVIDLDEPRGNDRPAWMPALVSLVFVLGGVGGYALGLAAGPSTRYIEAVAPDSTGRTDPAIREANRRIATCDSSSGFARAFDYCMGLGPWIRRSAPEPADLELS